MLKSRRRVVVIWQHLGAGFGILSIFMPGIAEAGACLISVLSGAWALSLTTLTGVLLGGLIFVLAAIAEMAQDKQYLYQQDQ